MCVWNVSLHFHFKIEMKIEKIVNFGFCTKIEFRILTPKPNVPYNCLIGKQTFKLLIFNSHCLF